MTLNFADIIVIGDDLSGITAASLLAKRGMNILLVDRPSLKRPTSISGLDNQIFKGLVSRLGVTEGRVRALKNNKIAFQVILPRHRIDVSTDNEVLLNEFSREFPESLDWAKELFEEVEDTFKQK
jgi:2-polyprenyl-6-methoxyphenol hydroxylase-like FAD-dependent oxidoreductase